MISLRSTASGDYISTSFGKLRHTNGHFYFSGIPGKNFFFQDFPKNICRVIQVGNIDSFSVAEFEVQKLERFFQFLNKL